MFPIPSPSIFPAVVGTVRSVSAKRAAPRAFTLIELLIVIAIIGTLAGLTLVAMSRIKIRQQIAVTQVELVQLQTAIERFHSATSAYPPDNPADPILSPLFYELCGTTNDSVRRIFQTLDGGSTVNAAALPGVFGVTGFLNSTDTGGEPPAKRCLSDLRPAQIGTVSVGGNAVKLLTGSVGWPAGATPAPVPSEPELNPWRYSSTHPTKNPGTYDLWIDLRIGSKTYRINNWSTKPEVF